jgi:hypothetical protein
MMGIDKKDVESVILTLAQEGPDYGIFKAEVYLNTNEVRYFAFDVVLNDELNERLETDFKNMSMLYDLQEKHGFKWVPRPYAIGDGEFIDDSGIAVKIKFLALEWLEHHAELHGYKGSEGNGFFLLTNYLKLIRGPSKRYLNNKESSYVRKHIIETLSLIFAFTFNNGKGVLVEKISINNGDFMALPLEGEAFDIRLITARQMIEATPEEFITYLYEHENEQYVETKIISGSIERRIPTFKFYNTLQEVREGVTNALEKVYGKEKGDEIAGQWLRLKEKKIPIVEKSVYKSL